MKCDKFYCQTPAGQVCGDCIESDTDATYGDSLLSIEAWRARNRGKATDAAYGAEPLPELTPPPVAPHVQWVRDAYADEWSHDEKTASYELDFEITAEE